MIKIESLINSIYSAVLTANDTLVKKNLDLLLDYFEDSEENEELRATLKKALNFSSHISLEDFRQKKKMIKVIGLLQDAAEMMNSDEGHKSLDINKVLKPKTVTIQYPNVTPHGVELHDVHVPLIAISPVSMTEITEVKFQTELEVRTVDDDLIVSFPTMKKKKDKSVVKDKDRKTTTMVEITITKKPTSDGLLKLIEGYEKALRAQIPG